MRRRYVTHVVTTAKKEFPRGGGGGMSGGSRACVNHLSYETDSSVSPLPTGRLDWAICLFLYLCHLNEITHSVPNFRIFLPFVIAFRTKCTHSLASRRILPYAHLYQERSIIINREPGKTGETSKNSSVKKKKKVKLSLYQAMEVHRIVRRWGSHSI
jgi:hypothetical protein